MNLIELIEKTVEGLGYEVTDFEQSPRGRLLRVFIDHAAGEGGIDVEDCTLVSNQLSRVLLVEEIDYDRLEVSSPGLDRVLKKLKDFARFVGSDVQLRTRMPINNRKNFTGRLLAVEGEQVRLDLGNETVTIEHANIDRCRIVPRFD